MLEHKDEIANFISFEPQSFEFYYFTESEFSEEQLNEVSPIRIKFNVIRHKRFDKAYAEYILARLISEDNDKRHICSINAKY